MNETPYSLCIVDDDPAICSLLQYTFHQCGYFVTTYLNGATALQGMVECRPDLIISDVNMPEMNGFELLRQVKVHFPRTKRALMTGQNIDEYLSAIRDNDIGNVFTKNGLGTNLPELVQAVQSLLTEDIFGIHRIFAQHKIETNYIRSSSDARLVCSRIVSLYQGPDRTFIEMALNELITNAVFHAILGLSGVSREYWHDEYDLGSRPPVKISWTRDAEKLGISVEDSKGELRKKDILQWFDRSSVNDVSCGEEHGRGLLLIRKLIDRFIVNIDPGKRTECILIHYENRSLSSKIKPITINELS